MPQPCGEQCFFLDHRFLSGSILIHGSKPSSVFRPDLHLFLSPISPATCSCLFLYSRAKYGKFASSLTFQWECNFYNSYDSFLHWKASTTPPLFYSKHCFLTNKLISWELRPVQSFSQVDLTRILPVWKAQKWNMKSSKVSMKSSEVNVSMKSWGGCRVILALCLLGATSVKWCSILHPLSQLLLTTYHHHHNHYTAPSFVIPLWCWRTYLLYSKWNHSSKSCLWVISNDKEWFLSIGGSIGIASLGF